MTNSSNLYRKVRSLIAKTVPNGCTAPEHVSATNLAATLVKKHDLDAARIDWPAPPAGFVWSGGPGRTVIVETPAKVEPKGKARKPAEPKAKPARSRKPAVPKGESKAKQPPFTNGERLATLAARPGGFTIEDITTMLGILPHTARALISVELRKLRGLKVEIVRETKRYRTVA